MADLTLEILQNREKYPDDRVITLGDGEQVTVKQFRDALQPRSEFTRASEGWKRRESELQQAYDGAQAQNAQLLEALNKRGPDVTEKVRTGEISEADLLADPVLGPLVKKQQDGLARIEAAEARLKQHEDYVMTQEYTGKLAAVSQRYNTRYNADGKGEGFDQKGFLDFMLKTRTPDVDVAYRAYTADREADIRAQEAEARGLERGKATVVPHVPFGRRSRPVKPEGIPESFQDVTEEMLAADPDIQAAMDKDLTG